MFLSGFIFVTIFNWLTSIKMELYLVGIWSLFVNAFIKSIYAAAHKIWLIEIDFDENFKVIMYVITAIILSILLAKFYNSKWFKKFLIKLGKKTLGNNVFRDVIDFDKKTMMLVYLKDSNYFYGGTFKYMDEHESDSYITLIDYSVFNKEDNQLLRQNNNKMSIVFSLHDIEHLELLYEEDSEIWKVLKCNTERKNFKESIKPKDKHNTKDDSVK